MSLDVDYLEALLVPQKSGETLYYSPKSRTDMSIVKGLVSDAHRHVDSERTRGELLKACLVF